MADGKFINTEIVNELDTIVDSFKAERLPNPFYNFNSSKGVTPIPVNRVSRRLISLV